jgi:hypothetical protein
MPVIHLTTIIHASIQRVFDISRSIDLHKVSMAHTGERAIAGTTKGLIKQGECVTWEAKHLFKTRRLTTCITHMSAYNSFTDEMVKGDFSMMKHVHIFTSSGFVTTMEDVFTFASPYGLVGKIVDALFLKNYMKRLLKKRNCIIKEYAEDKMWIIPRQ